MTLGGGQAFLVPGRKGKAYPVGGGLPGCRNSTCHFAAPLPGQLQLQGWGLATGAGQAGSSLIPHRLPRLTLVPGGPGRGPWGAGCWRGWGGRWAAQAPSVRPGPVDSAMCVGGSGEGKTLVPRHLFHFPTMPGRRARVWEVCLPASSSSSSPNSRNRPGRLQLRRENSSRRAQLGGVGAGTGAGGQIQTEPETPTPKPDGTDTPTLTHSHTLGLVPPCQPPCKDTQTPSANPANPQNTPWTHKEIWALAPTPHPPTSPVGSTQQPEGGEGNRGRKDSRRPRGRVAKALGTRVSLATLFSQKPSKSRQSWLSCQGPCQLPTLPKPPLPARAWGAGRVLLAPFTLHGDSTTFPSPRECS